MRWAFKYWQSVHEVARHVGESDAVQASGWLIKEHSRSEEDTLFEVIYERGLLTLGKVRSQGTEADHAVVAGGDILAALVQRLTTEVLGVSA